MAAKFERMAPRSTRATVGRITWTWYLKLPAACFQLEALLPAFRQILEPRVLFDEGQLRRASRAVALLSDDDLREPFGFLIRLAVSVAVIAPRGR